jgi:hypothetical protein
VDQCRSSTIDERVAPTVVERLPTLAVVPSVRAERAD